jgi:cellulose synthase/poly-beta-1,6-N-acetylglucosamine synthase-like glycosyltransferase
MNIFLFVIIGFLSVIWLFWVYQIIIGLKGLGPIDSLTSATKYRKFAILIPASNEEKVIGNLISSLKSQTYPSEKYEIIVACDNCKDKTASVSKGFGIKVLEREDELKRGKTWNIQWALSQIKINDFDAVLFFDADNIVDGHFLAKMNEYLECNPNAQAIQGFLETKNSRDSWISKLYAVTYWFQNRFWSYARSKMGLSIMLGGTGMLLTSQCLKKYGWHPQSLAEDFEYSAQLILSGEKIHYNMHAKSYDEKPIDAHNSRKQRSRWLQGIVWVFRKYGLIALKKALIERNLQYLDLFFTLISPGKTAVIYALTIFSFLFFPCLFFFESILVKAISLIWLGTGIIQCLFIFVLSPSLHFKKVTIKYLSLFPHIIWYSLKWLPSFLKSIWSWKNQTTWLKTEHVSDITIEEINDQKEPVI